MRPPTRRFPLDPTVALLAVAILAGCGDDGGGTMTKAEFVARGDEICRQAREQFVAAQLSPPTTPARAVALQEELIQTSETELNQMRALDAPSEVQSELDRYLAAREQGIAGLKKGLEAARDKDLRAYAAARAQVAAGQLHRLKLAQAVGFSDCSRPIPQAAGAGE